MEVHDHCRIPDTDSGQDSVLSGMILAATAKLEVDANIALMAQQFRFSVNRFCTITWLPRPPLVLVDQITYLDVDGTSQVVDSALYRVHTDNVPGVVSVAPEADWPEVEAGAYLPIQFEYTAGYASAADVPATAKQAIYMLVAYWYEQRETAGGYSVTEAPMAYEALAAQLTTGEYTKVLT